MSDFVNVEGTLDPEDEFVRQVDIGWRMRSRSDARLVARTQCRGAGLPELSVPAFASSFAFISYRFLGRQRPCHKVSRPLRFIAQGAAGYEMAIYAIKWWVVF